MSIAQSRLVRKFDVLKYIKFDKFEIEWVIVQIITIRELIKSKLQTIYEFLMYCHSVIGSQYLMAAP